MKENDRLDTKEALLKRIDKALAGDPDLPINREQERILRSVVLKTVGPTAQPGRKCGSCTLCCKLTPVVELKKGANERCKHQRHTGCAIYHKRPFSCQAWNCRWLLNDDTDDLRRPDHAHYVIDVMPDYATMRIEATGEEHHFPILQIWVDPKFPDAHRDPALRAYLLRRGEEGMASIIRYSASDGFILFPPNMSANHQWNEQRGENVDRGGDGVDHMVRMSKALGATIEIRREER